MNLQVNTHRNAKDLAGAPPRKDKGATTTNIAGKRKATKSPTHTLTCEEKLPRSMKRKTCDSEESVHLPYNERNEKPATMTNYDRKPEVPATTEVHKKNTGNQRPKRKRRWPSSSDDSSDEIIDTKFDLTLNEIFKEVIISSSESEGEYAHHDLVKAFT